LTGQIQIDRIIYGYTKLQKKVTNNLLPLLFPSIHILFFSIPFRGIVKGALN